MKNKFVFLISFAILFVSVLGCSYYNPLESDSNSGVTDNRTLSDKAIDSTLGRETIGVPECDEYVEKYEICIMSKAPEAQRAMLKTTFEQARQSWKQAAASPQGKAALPNACKQALEIAKQTTIAYGCVW